MAAPSEKDPGVPGIDPQAVYVGGESLADRLVPHIKKILAVAGIVSVLIAGVLVYRWWAHRQAEKATAELMEAIIEVRRPVGAAAAMPGPDGEAPATFASSRERAEKVLAELSHTRGAPRDGARLLEASMLLDAGRLDEAEAAYRRLAARPGLEGVLAREGVGFVAEARAAAAEGEARTRALEAALEAFRHAQPDEAGPRRDYTLYHQSRLLALLGRTDEARVSFQHALDAVRADPTSGLELMVELRIAQLDAAPAAAPDPTAPVAPGDAGQETGTP